MLEKMRAETQTERSALINAVTAQYLEDPLFLAVPFEHKRGQPYRWTGQAIYFMANPTYRKAIDAPHLGDWIGSPQPVASEFATDVHKTFQILIKLLARDKDREFLKVSKGTQKVSPVDFVAMVSLIWEFKGRSSEAELARRRKQMREHARESHKDLYWKPAVLDTYLKFLDYIRNNTFDELADDKPAPGRSFYDRSLVSVEH